LIFGKKSGASSVPDIHLLLEEALEKLKERAPGYRIRRAEEEDLIAVQKINYVSLPENYPPYFFHDLWERFKDAFYVAE
jgi:ribosomal-protein-alanine N-acetyltransferase